MESRPHFARAVAAFEPFPRNMDATVRSVIPRPSSDPLSSRPRLPSRLVVPSGSGGPTRLPARSARGDIVRVAADGGASSSDGFLRNMFAADPKKPADGDRCAGSTSWPFLSFTESAPCVEIKFQAPHAIDATPFGFYTGPLPSSPSKLDRAAPGATASSSTGA